MLQIKKKFIVGLDFYLPFFWGNLELDLSLKDEQIRFEPKELITKLTLFFTLETKETG